MKLEVRKHIIMLFSLVLVISSSPAFSQKYKSEKEERLTKDDFPVKAIDILDPFLERARRIRYFSETDEQTKGFECKFKLNKKTFSVEFTKEGELEDVEYLIDMEAIPEKTASAINTYLEDHYEKYRYRRIQKQYSGADDQLNDQVILGRALKSNAQDLLVRYEIEVDGRQNNDLVNHELLFDQDGNFLKKRTIIDRQIDNILY